MKLEKLDDVLIRRVQDGYAIFHIGMVEQEDGTYAPEEMFLGSTDSVDKVLEHLSFLLFNPSMTNETV